MTTNDTVTLADIDRVLPAEYEVLSATDPRNNNHAALRAVRHDSMAQVHYFYSIQEYFTFVVSIAPRNRLLAEESGTRYVQLSATYDADPYFHASMTHTVAALSRSSVILHRMKSDETSVRFALSLAEMAALVESYQTYLMECDNRTPAPEFDPFTDVSDEHASLS